MKDETPPSLLMEKGGKNDKRESFWRLLRLTEDATERTKSTANTTREIWPCACTMKEICLNKVRAPVDDDKYRVSVGEAAPSTGGGVIRAQTHTNKQSRRS